MDVIKTPHMTNTSKPSVKDQEIFSDGVIESASVNLIADYNSSKSNDNDVIDEMEKNDFINNFICHLIFYVVFCISLSLHIFIDLGLRSFLKKFFIQFSEIIGNNFVEKKPAYA